MVKNVTVVNSATSQVPKESKKEQVQAVFGTFLECCTCTVYKNREASTSVTRTQQHSSPTSPFGHFSQLIKPQSKTMIILLLFHWKTDRRLSLAFCAWVSIPWSLFWFQLFCGPDFLRNMSMQRVWRDLLLLNKVYYVLIGHTTLEDTVTLFCTHDVMQRWGELLS